MTANRPTRKASNEEILKWNSLGLSLQTQGNLLGMHPTTITQRLAALNVPPADTRRAFMEDIINQMSEKEVDWLADQLGPKHSIKAFIQNLLAEQFVRAQNKEPSNDQ